MVINALQMKKEGRLNDNMVVGTVMSNLGFGKALKKYGCQTVSTKVGDRYVLEEMLKHNYSIGGEQSGHIIFPNSIPPATASSPPYRPSGYSAKTERNSPN